MLWALTDDGARSPAFPHGRARCPDCAGEMLAKCGEIVVPHWAHIASDCDPWSEPESPWHLAWKGEFPSAWQEVSMERAGTRHRADVRTPKCVVEFQSSPIDPDSIRARERFYGRMVWVLNAGAWSVSVREQKRYVTFRWKWPSKSWWTARRPLVMDLWPDRSASGGLAPWRNWVADGYPVLTTGHDDPPYPPLLWVRKLYDHTPCGGWGHLITRRRLLQRLGHSEAI